MVNIVGIAAELGYLDIPEGTLVDIDEIIGLPGNQACILTTGSQGEPMSALTRMANHDHQACSDSTWRYRDHFSEPDSR